MKIIPGPPIREIAGDSPVGKGQKSAAAGFGSVFEETLKAEASVKPKAATVPRMGGVPPIPSKPMDLLDKKALIGRTRDLIETLDQYRRKLADPGASLREVYPVLQRLEDQKDQLLPAMDSLKDADGLKGILNQALVTVSLETVKFNNGHYID